MMKKKYHLNLKKIKFQNENLETYKKLIYYLDEPVADPAIIPAYQLAYDSRSTGRYVMMSGMGGDEIDAGYTRHSILSNKKLLFLAAITPKIIIKLIYKGKKLQYFNRLQEFAWNATPENYFSLTSYFSKLEIDALINNKNWVEGYKNKINNLCKPVTGKKRFFYLDFKGFLASHNLIYMDKASMAASVEVRVPLLDKNLVQKYFNDIDKIEFSGKKRLKFYLKSLLGNNYKEIRKEGFRYKINNWLLNEINWEEIEQFFKENELINIQTLNSYLKEMRQNNVENVAMKLWTIFTLYLWLVTFDVQYKTEKK